MKSKIIPSEFVERVDVRERRIGRRKQRTEVEESICRERNTSKLQW